MTMRLRTRDITERFVPIVYGVDAVHWGPNTGVALAKVAAMTPASTCFPSLLRDRSNKDLRCPNPKAFPLISPLKPSAVTGTMSLMIKRARKKLTPSLVRLRPITMGLTSPLAE